MNRFTSPTISVPRSASCAVCGGESELSESDCERTMNVNSAESRAKKRVSFFHFSKASDPSSSSKEKRKRKGETRTGGGVRSQ